MSPKLDAHLLHTNSFTFSLRIHREMYTLLPEEVVVRANFRLVEDFYLVHAGRKPLVPDSGIVVLWRLP